MSYSELQDGQTAYFTKLSRSIFINLQSKYNDDGKAAAKALINVDCSPISSKTAFKIFNSHSTAESGRAAPGLPEANEGTDPFY